MKKYKKNIILVGGGGHCVSVIDIIENNAQYKILGILDSNIKKDNILGYPIIGGDDLIPKLVNENTYFLITIGQIKTPLPRKKIAKILSKNGARLATVISSLAYVSKHALISEGTVVMNHAVINEQARIGKNCIINTKSNIEHGVIIDDFCHISTCAVVNGDSTIGKDSFIGSNSTISNNIKIKDNSIIGAGKFIR